MLHDLIYLVKISGIFVQIKIIFLSLPTEHWFSTVHA